MFVSLISESNKAQKQAITHGEGPQLIVAGAGTGKTRVVTARIAWLITEKNVNVDQILALTFTDKSAQEMEERVDQMLPYGYVDLWISTFHSFCDKILKRYGLEVGLLNDYKLLNQTEAWLLVKQNLDRFNLDYYKPLGSPTKFIHALLSHFSRCKDEGIYPEDYLDYAKKIKQNNDGATSFVKSLDVDLEGLTTVEKEEVLQQEILRINEIANAYHIYQQVLLENDALDFSDLINYTIKLLKKRPLILQKLRKQFEYILVDEFQDTNFVQYELIRMLAMPKNNITVVGDDDQSIYKFRGASITNIMQFKNDYPEAKEVVLTENYRSVQEVLDLSYQFIKQNDPNRLEVKLGIDKKLNSNISENGLVEHLHFDRAEDEAKGVIEKIIELREKDKKEWSDFAILLRANSSAELFISYLNQMQVPYQFLALKGLYNKSVILDIINYFKLLDNYHESSAVFRVLNFEYLNLDPNQIVQLVHYAKRKAISLFGAVRQGALVPGVDKGTVEKLNQLLAFIDKQTQDLKTKKPTEIFMEFIYKSGYLQHLTKEENLQTKEQTNYIQQFFQKLQSFERSENEADLRTFLELIRMEMEAGDSGSLPFDPEVGPDMIKIMTVHSAKGLEFDYVFLPNLVDRKFPTDQRKEAIEIPLALIKESLPEGDFHLEEERRLFYVAMTRAKKQLYLTSAEDYGGARKKKLSRFITEIAPLMTNQPQIHKSTNSVDLNPILKIQTLTTENLTTYLPKKFSFSQMQTYEKCPYQYRFANVLKIPTFGSHFFSFGTTIHNALQKFLEKKFNLDNGGQIDLFGESQKKAKMSVDDLLKIYEECWIDDWYLDEEQKQKSFVKGKKLLKSFYVDFENKSPKVKFLEQIFNLKIGEYTFNGRIDRVDELNGGKVEIIDYKTGKPKDKLNPDDRQQLLFYQIAAEEALNLQVENLKYYYVEDEKNPERDFIGKEKEKEKLKDKFLQNISGIKQGNFKPKPSKFVCQYCQYKDICDFRKL